MGEQRPMDTLRGFVRSVWELDERITANGLPNSSAVWSKPDLRTGSLELRQSRPDKASRPRPSVRGCGPIFMNFTGPTSRVARLGARSRIGSLGSCCVILSRGCRRGVFLAWLLLWVLVLIVALLSLATVLPTSASIAGFSLWHYPPLVWLSRWEAWQLAAMAGFLALVANQFVVPYFGRVVRYTRATPENIAARKNIRERGLSLLSELHKEDYDRIIVVGHSLGSILAYDLISYFWATRYDHRTVVAGTPEFLSLQQLEGAVAALVLTPTPPRPRLHATHFWMRSAPSATCCDRGPSPRSGPRSPVADHRSDHTRIAPHARRFSARAGRPRSAGAPGRSQLSGFSTHPRGP